MPPPPSCLTFPQRQHPQLQGQHLQVLTDGSSSYAAVVKVCLQLTLAAGNDGTGDTSSCGSAVVVHDGMYAASMSSAWQSQFKCLK
jgi:hypothetical protein